MRNEMQQSANDEISLKDIIDFFRRNFKLIIFFGGVGLILSILYLTIKPVIYEAKWQMQMALNSEDPVSLIQRLRMPTTYTLMVRQRCGMPENGEFREFLDGILKLEAVKNVTGQVELKVFAPNAERAKKCAESVAELIETQQRDLIEYKLQGRDELLAMLQATLNKEIALYGGLNKYEIGSLKYIAKLERISGLNTRIDNLKEELLMSQKHPAKLISPIYVPSTPVQSRTNLIVSLGLLTGILMGILFASSREWWLRVS